LRKEAPNLNHTINLKYRVKHSTKLSRGGEEKMKRHTFLLIGILVITSLLLGACRGATDTPEPAAPTDVPAAPTDAPAEPTDEPMDTGLLMGMDADALEEAGYVVIPPGEPVRLGASVALTGPIPEFGLDISQSYQLSVSDLNAAGGVLGHEYEIDIQDGACDGDAATVVGNGFAADPSIVAVAGGTCTGETLGLVPILSEARIPFVSASATNPAITSPDCDICNRVALSDKAQGDVDADYVINTLGFTNVAVMHDNSDYGLGLAGLFRDAFEQLGGTTTAFEGVQVGDTDFRAALTLVSTGAPDLIFFGGYVTEGALIASQMKEVGLEDAIFFSDDGVFGDPFIETAGAAAEGNYASFVTGDEVAGSNAVFDAAYEEMFGVHPDNQGPFHAQAYDSVQLLANAIASVAVEDDNGEGYVLIEREALIQAIRSTQNLVGLAGTMTCSAIGDCGAGGIQIFQVQDGAFVQVSGFGLE
jgi:branched-chain amino acid transport system substrate-binding protein